MTFKAIIVDDEEYAREIVRSLLQEDDTVEIVASCADGKAAISAIKKHQPDIVFLDIQMPEVNGFEVIAQTREFHTPRYIFTTAYDEFALKAFEVNAIDYLLKPFDDDRFFSALQRAKEKANDQQNQALAQQLQAFIAANKREEQPYLKKLSVRTGGKIHFVSEEQIDWIEADNQYVRIHTSTKVHTHRESLNYLEKHLDPAVFVRIHRSIMVNVNRITSLEPHFKGDFMVILDNGTRLKMAKSRKEALRSVMRW